MNSYYQPNNINPRKVKEINLKELFSVIKRRFWIIIVITAITTLLGAVYSYSKNTPLYQSSARIIIGANPDDRNTLQVIIKDSTVLDIVIKDLNLQTSPEALASQITVQSIDNTQVFSISVTDRDPNQAAKIANTTAKVFKKEISNIVDFKDVRFLSEAKVNPWPINQNQYRFILILFIVGVVLGIGLVLLLDSLDDTIRKELDIEEILGLPVLGKVSKMSKKNVKKKLIKRFELRGGDN
ncbi:YveK family protein [Heyndrickxia sp. NPDC080065]|uniref:YveK family protein n=1 Tax=Heyndrickxia sp. NPDC080065 TaxID=3390568 RepID=UPI003CFF173B